MEVSRPRKITIFVGGPNDVQEEHKLALEIIEKVGSDPLWKNKVDLQPIAWDRPVGNMPLLASTTPQQALNQGLSKPSECDIALFIVWSRMGTPLPPEYKKPDGSPYLSGTEWQYHDAIAAAQKNTKPFVVLYRCNRPINLDVNDLHFDEKKKQYDRVKEFFDSITNRGQNSYTSLEDFQTQLTKHLRALVIRLVDTYLPESDEKSLRPELLTAPKKVFISYRRDDSADTTGRIYDRLIHVFSKNAIFKDVDSIPLGYDFKEHLENAVNECAVQLVIIGQQWLTMADGRSGRRRLDDPQDFVRIEVEAALNRNIPVIPILVQGATMPTMESLPDTMAKLASRQGTPVRRDPDFHTDMDRVIRALEKILK